MDLLENGDFVQHVCDAFDFTNWQKPCEAWERFKSSIQTMSQEFASFQKKQSCIELQALCHSLRIINNRIYAGKNLAIDRIHLENRITQVKEHAQFFSDWDENLEWIINEGKMVPSFLHLEDERQSLSIDKLELDGLVTSDLAQILGGIHGFYSILYASNDSQLDQDIENFLVALPSLPKIKQDTTHLELPISMKEVEAAIKSLHTGKSLGSDGITADFYKYFVDEVSVILAKVFNQIWEDSALTWSQRMAIIILLYKKRQSAAFE